MPDSNDINASFVIVDSIDHTIIANANPPQELFALQLTATFWTWRFCQSLNLGKDAVDDHCIECFEFFPG